MRQIGHTLVVGGWVKTGRMAEKNTLLFLELNDGSSPQNLQARNSLPFGLTTPQPRWAVNKSRKQYTAYNAMESTGTDKSNLQNEPLDIY